LIYLKIRLTTASGILYTSHNVVIQVASSDERETPEEELRESLADIGVVAG
jgi:hypothetical protein